MGKRGRPKKNQVEETQADPIESADHIDDIPWGESMDEVSEAEAKVEEIQPIEPKSKSVKSTHRKFDKFQ